MTSGVVGVLLCLSVASRVAAQESPPRPEPPTEVARLAGDGRVETAVALSQAGWETATVAVLARADDPSDALGGTVLAGSLDAPLLLSARDRLPVAVATELRRLGVDEVRLLGGAQALDDQVGDDVRALGAEVVRHSGEDRYATGVAVARAVGETGTAYLVPGEGRTTSEAIDALAVGALAAARGVPLLPTPSGDPPETSQPSAETTLPEPLAAYLREFQPRVREIGPVYARFGTVLADQYSVSTLAGADRYETARALFGEWASDRRPTAGTVLLGDGTRGADLLAAGALAARLDAPLLLIDGRDPSASPTTYAALDAIGTRLDDLLVVGGPAAVSNDVVAAALHPDSQILQPPGGQIATYPEGEDPRTLEDQRLETSAYLIAAPSQTDPEVDQLAQVTLRNTGTRPIVRGFTAGGCAGPRTITSQQWDGRSWRSSPYTSRHLQPLRCPDNVPVPQWLDPGAEVAYPFPTRALGQYRIDLDAPLDLSVLVEVLGCRGCDGTST